MNQFKMDFRRNLKSLLIWSGVTAAVTALITALYPSMMQSDMLALMNAKLASLPEELVAALHLEGQDIRELPQYFAYMFQFIAMTMCVYGATLGLTSLSREESEGTIEFLYAQPTRRRSQIVSARLASACVSYLVYCITVGIAAVLACTGVKPETLSLADLVAPVKSVLAGAMLAGYTYLFLGLAVSVFLKKPKHAASLAVGLILPAVYPGKHPLHGGRVGLFEMDIAHPLFYPESNCSRGDRRAQCAYLPWGDGGLRGRGVPRLSKERFCGLTAAPEPSSEGFLFAGNENFFEIFCNIRVFFGCYGIIGAERRKGRLKRRKQHRPMTWKEWLWIALLAVLVAALVMAAVFIYRAVMNPRAAFGPQTSPQATGTGNPAVSAPAEVSEEFATDRVNILLLGMDSNEERQQSDRVDFRTDTMLLVSIDFSKEKVDMITVPRDSYVTVTKAAGSLYKVNSAAYFGGGMCDSGFKNACDTISGVFGGIPVNYYAAVDMDGLSALVDAIGGVYYDVDVNASLDGVTLKKGYALLSGKEALTYCRVRKGIGTDIDRQERQQKLLVAVFEQLKTNGKIGDIPEIYQAVSDMVITNLTFEQICALAVFAARFDLNDIRRHVLEGEYHWAYGVYYYLLDQQAKTDLVKEIFGVKIAPMRSTISIMC
jgi:LCP family protein required for cell wall assembly